MLNSGNTIPFADKRRTNSLMSIRDYPFREQLARVSRDMEQG
jgi:hypothetical protein